MDVANAIALTELAVKLGYSKPTNKEELVLEIAHNADVIKHLEACDNFRVENGKLMANLIHTKNAGNPQGAAQEVIVHPKKKTA